MALLLCLETSASVCSVALCQEENMLALAERFEENIHASQLTLLVEEVCRKAGKSLQELQAVALSMGPGSYTGLRVGVSSAKGLCYALDIPMIGVNTLQSMAALYAAQTPLDDDTLICPMIDARRMEVYTALFSSKADFINESRAEILDENSFVALRHKKVHFIGSGAAKFQAWLPDFPLAKTAPDLLPSASILGKLALARLRARQYEDLALFEPFYLKDFVGAQLIRKTP